MTRTPSRVHSCARSARAKNVTSAADAMARASSQAYRSAPPIVEASAKCVGVTWRILTSAAAILERAELASGHEHRARQHDEEGRYRRGRGAVRPIARNQPQVEPDVHGRGNRTQREGSGASAQGDEER